jgi:ribose transport system substrate-binding protein
MFRRRRPVPAFRALLRRQINCRRRRGSVVLAALCAVLALVTACGDDKKGDAPGAATAPTPSGSASGPPVDFMTESKNIVANSFKGTNKSPDGAARLAAKGIRIAIISRGQQSPSSKIPTDAAEEAARVLGWDVLRYDLALEPRRASQAIREALQVGVHGIVTNVDCAYAPQEFADAKSRGVLIIPLFAFDCTDPTVTGITGPPQFTTFTNYTGNPQQRGDPARQNAGAGALAAAAVIVATQGKAKVLAFNETTSTVLNYMHIGFVSQIKKCTTCQLLEEIKYTAEDVASGALRGKVDDALRRHPEVTAIRGANSTAVQTAIAPALVAKKMQNQVTVVGGEGLPTDLDLIRANQGLNITLSFDTPWHAWAAVDTLNSTLNGQPGKFPGVGYMLIDKDHNLPPSGPVQHNVNYKDVYRKAWGVG